MADLYRPAEEKMRLIDSRSADARFADLLDRSKGFLAKVGIDVADYRALARQGAVSRAAAALVEEAERRNARLPPGYWQSLQRLREEPIQPGETTHGTGP